jgi:hypothetical protein
MANIKALDAEIEKTRSVVNDMRSKIEVSGEVLERLSDADAKLGDPQFDIENARIQDVLRQQRMMETNIADLIIGLEDATNVFGAEFESMKGFSGSRASWRCSPRCGRSACAQIACATCRCRAICRSC